MSVDKILKAKKAIKLRSGSLKNFRSREKL